MINHFSQAFIKGPFRKHREEIYYETERALLPQTQHAASEIETLEKRIKSIEIPYPVFEENVNACKDIYLKYNQDYLATMNYDYYLRNSDIFKTMYNRLLLVEDLKDEDLESFMFHLNCIKNWKESQSSISFIQIRIRAIYNYESRNTTSSSNERKVIKPCFSDNCRGFIEQNGVCKMCKMIICTKCHQEKLENHTCHPDDVATAEFLMNDTKPCPKCAAAIHKLEGCDQMFCTQCQTPFSWKSGEMVHGTIHNPHYFEWLRTQNRPERNPMDIICGREINNPIIQWIIRELQHRKYWSQPPPYNFERHLQRVFESIIYIKATAEGFPVYDAIDSRRNRIEYLRNKIDESTFKKKIFLKQKHNDINREIRQWLLLFRDVCTELVFNLYTHLQNSTSCVYTIVEDFMKEVMAIQKMVNDNMEDTCKAFGIKKRCFNVKFMNCEWNIRPV